MERPNAAELLDKDYVRRHCYVYGGNKGGLESDIEFMHIQAIKLEDIVLADTMQMASYKRSLKA